MSKEFVCAAVVAEVLGVFKKFSLLMCDVWMDKTAAEFHTLRVLGKLNTACKPVDFSASLFAKRKRNWEPGTARC